MIETVTASAEREATFLDLLMQVVEQGIDLGPVLADLAAAADVAVTS